MAVPHGPVASAIDVERAMFDFVDEYDRAYERAAAEHGFSAAQACVLGRVDIPRGMRELADELGCDASNITQLVRRLETRGLIEREISPDDRRAKNLRRTTDGDRVYADFEATFQFARAVTARLDSGEQEQLARLLRKALTR